MVSNSSIYKYRIFILTDFPPTDGLKACAKRSRERTKDTNPHLAHQESAALQTALL